MKKACEKLQNTNKYLSVNNKNPFSSQCKLLLHIEHLYKYFFGQQVYPFFIEANITSRCNLKCSWCISINHRCDAEIEYDSFITFLCDYKKNGGESITLSGGGEPTMHTRFKDIVVSVVSNGLKLGLMTNGVYNKSYNSLISENCQWVRVSLDTLNHSKYKDWKSVDAVDVVVDNIMQLSKNGTKIGINCNINKNHDYRDIDDLCKFIDKVSYIQFRPVLPRYFKNESVEINQNVWDYLINNYSGNPKINFSNDKFEDLSTNKLFDFGKCEGHHFSPILNSNGDLCVCMYHPNDERFVFGNIYKNSLEEIWNSGQRKYVLKFLDNLDYSKECQVCCKLAEANKLINAYKTRHNMEDYNFL